MKLMRPPDRLPVPTCIGCVAMSPFGTCDTRLPEHKLELVRAATYDALETADSNARTRAESFADLAISSPGVHEFEPTYRSAESAARGVLRRHPDVNERAIDWEEAAEHATRSHRERSGAAGDNGCPARAAERAAKLREALGDGLDCAPVIVGVPEAKVKADRASVEVEHWAGLDAVLEVRGARLPEESAEPCACLDGRRVKRRGAC